MIERQHVRDELQLIDELYDRIIEFDDYEDCPKQEGIRKDLRPVNSHRVLLKRTEGARNRQRKNETE